MKHSLIYLITTFMLFLTACTSSESEPVVPKLALEAWIDSGGYPVAIFTKSVSPDAHDTELKETMIRWGKVSITDGVDTLVMTGGVDYSVFPPFSYRNFEMEGRVDATYTIIGEYQGQRITATSKILAPAEIKEIEFQKISGTDSCYSGRVDFIAPATTDTCMFVLFTRVRNREDRHYPALLGTIKVALGQRECSMALYRGKHQLEPYQANFIEGDIVDVILARVEPNVFRFWDAYQNAVYFDNYIFLSSNSPIQGNVEHGYGIFSARGIDRKVVTVGLAQD